MFTVCKSDPTAHEGAERDTHLVMSEEATIPDLAELTERVYGFLNARDFDSVVANFGPTSAWDVSRWGLGTHTGLDAIRLFLHDWFGSMDEYEVQIEELHDLGNGVVSGVVLQTGHSPGSHGLLRVRSAPVFLWVDGRIAQVTLYPDIEQGHAAAEQLAGARDGRRHRSSVA
jgi:hypothetical protein